MKSPFLITKTILFLFLANLTMTNIAWGATKASDFLVEGMQKYKKGEYQQAYKDFINALKLDKSSVEALYLIGTTSIKLRLNDQTEKIISTLQQVAPEHKLTKRLDEELRTQKYNNYFARTLEIQAQQDLLTSSRLGAAEYQAKKQRKHYVYNKSRTSTSGGRSSEIIKKLAELARDQEAANSWRGKKSEARQQNERSLSNERYRLRKELQAINGVSSQREPRSSSSRNIGQCMGGCGSEQGICMGQCNGNGQCISNCATAHGRCVSRCN